MSREKAYSAGSGALQGATTGATIGSVIPGVGTAIGAGVGAVAGGLAGLFGSKKRPSFRAPEFIDVQTVDVQKDTGINLGDVSKANIQANLQNLPLAQQLVAQSDAFEQDRLLGLTEKAMPGFRRYQELLTRAGQERLEDPYALPSDQEEYLRRKAAEQGITRGTAGQFNEFDLMRDFGISSMQYGSQRLAEAQGIF